MAILKPDELDIISSSAEQTRRIGTRLGTLLKPGDVVCLSGDMGAGKTVFSSGVGAGWGATTALTSPTYNLVHEHRREKDRVRLYHMDCYRLHGPQDAETIGMDDLLDGSGVVLFEWPELIESILPPDYLWVELRVLEEQRRNFVFEGTNKHYKDLITKFREATFGV